MTKFVDIHIIYIPYKKNFRNYFSSTKNGFISFFLSYGIHQSHHLVGCHATGMPRFVSCIIFTYFASFISITPSYNLNKSFRINLIEIIIIRVKIIRIYTKNTHFITRKCDITRIFVKKDYIIIKNYNIIKVFNQANQIQILWLTDNHRQLYDTFFVSYICQGNILA